MRIAYNYMLSSSETFCIVFYSVRFTGSCWSVSLDQIMIIQLPGLLIKSQVYTVQLKSVKIRHISNMHNEVYALCQAVCIPIDKVKYGVSASSSWCQQIVSREYVTPITPLQGNLAEKHFGSSSALLSV